jgi:hypothetical protein
MLKKKIHREGMKSAKFFDDSLCEPSRASREKGLSRNKT